MVCLRNRFLAQMNSSTWAFIVKTSHVFLQVPQEQRLIHRACTKKLNIKPVHIYYLNSFKVFLDSMLITRSKV